MPTRPLALASLAAALLSSFAASAKPQTCFLLQELGGRSLARVNPKLCAKRLPPASTFKIPHALIALEAGVLADEHLRWDPPAGKQEYPEWSRPHDLASAMRYSVVWYFQKIARTLGSEREAEWLEKLGYGNKDVSGPVDRFWINGPLLLTADEQMAFLQKLFAGTLPASQRGQALVKKILEQEPTKPWAAGREFRIEPWPANTVLRAKSGTSPRREVSWYVGELERDGKHYLFVTRVQGKPLGNAAEETFRRLKKAGLL